MPISLWLSGQVYMDVSPERYVNRCGCQKNLAISERRPPWTIASSAVRVPNACPIFSRLFAQLTCRWMA
jgi:hypothetical protein